MIFRLLIESLLSHPRGTLLILIAILNLLWVSYTLFPKRKYRIRIYRIYSFCAVSALLWVITNAYFQSGFLISFSEGFAKGMAIAANIASSFAAIGFFWLASAMTRQEERSSSHLRLLILVLVAVALVINLIPGLTVREVRVLDAAVEGVRFALIFGKGNAAFFISGFILLIAAFVKFIKAVKSGRDRLENTRYYYILFAMSVMYVSLIVFHMILPSVFGNYNYVWIPPFLTILQVLTVGYAIVTRRFIDIALFVSRLLKLLVSFGLSIGIALACFRGFEMTVPGASLLFRFTIIILVSILGFFGAMKFFDSFTFYRYFGAASSEHFRRMTKALKEQGRLYISVKDFEHDIRKSFSSFTKGIRPRIITLDHRSRRKYQHLVRYFKYNSGILVTEEVKLAENDRKTIPLLKELESLGGICLPLFHPMKGLVGLFSLGEKNYDHLYSREEITAIEDMGAYLNFTITGILYNAELESEVEVKTAEIRRKTTVLKKQVKELKTFLDKQSDFIAVTAHEFRTPLSIALFQTEDLMSEVKKSKKRLEQAEAIHDSLQNLKDLIQNVFTVQQLDLNKVEIHPEKTDIKALAANIFTESANMMKEGHLNFIFEDNLKDATYSEIDPLLIREVLHHLLDNARKFTPRNGKVILRIAASNKEITVEVHDSGEGVPGDRRAKIFEKYSTNHSSQGIGLGLYICRKIMELHQGKIQAKASKLGGASFGILLDRAN